MNTQNETPQQRFARALGRGFYQSLMRHRHPDQVAPDFDSLSLENQATFAAIGEDCKRFFHEAHHAYVLEVGFPTFTKS